MAKRITFFIARFSRSGVPLAQIRLAKAMRRRGHEVVFVIGYVPDGLGLPIIEGVDVINLGLPRTYKMLVPVYQHIKRRDPEVIFTAEDHLNAIVTTAALLAGSRAKISASSRVTPYDTYSDKLLSKRWVLKQLSKVLRRRIDAHVCVSEDMVKQYEKTFGVDGFQCVYNVVCDCETSARIREPVLDPWITESPVPLVVTAGRLAPEKGFPDLLRAIRILVARTPVRLAILGEGPMRPELEAMIVEQGLTDHVRLLGFQENPLKFFSKARVFVLSSYVEGLPNVLVEAMACGCTPVSTDCPTGPREVLQGGKYGFLVPMRAPHAMAEAIREALNTPTSVPALNEAIAPFTEERVLMRHHELVGV